MWPKRGRALCDDDDSTCLTSVLIMKKFIFDIRLSWNLQKRISKSEISSRVHLKWNSFPPRRRALSLLRSHGLRTERAALVHTGSSRKVNKTENTIGRVCTCTTIANTVPFKGSSLPGAVPRGPDSESPPSCLVLVHTRAYIFSWSIVCTRGIRIQVARALKMQ